MKEMAEDSTPLYPMFFGGGQEGGLRPGTENTPVCINVKMLH